MTAIVSVTFVYGESVCAATIARQASAEEVRSLWGRLSGRPVAQHRFRLGARDGPELPRDAVVADLLEAGALCCLVFVITPWLVTARVPASCEAALELCCQPEAPVQQLIGRVRFQLDIGEEHAIRVRRNDRVLQPEASLGEQLAPVSSLAGDVELQVDVEPLPALKWRPVISDKEQRFLPVTVERSVSSAKAPSSDELTKVHLVVRTRRVVVTAWGGRVASFSSVREGTAFDAFLAMVEKAVGESLPADTSFKCGCGRLFSRLPALDWKHRHAIAHYACERPATRHQIWFRPDLLEFSTVAMACFLWPAGALVKILENT